MFNLFVGGHIKQNSTSTNLRPFLRLVTCPLFQRAKHDHSAEVYFTVLDTEREERLRLPTWMCSRAMADTDHSLNKGTLLFSYSRLALVFVGRQFSSVSHHLRTEDSLILRT